MAATATRAEVIEFKLEKHPGQTEFFFSSGVGLRTVLRTRVPQCDPRIVPPGSVTALVDGSPTHVWSWASDNTCSGDVLTTIGHISVNVIDLGTHTFSASYSGGDGFAPASDELVVEVFPEYRGDVLGGAGIAGLGIDSYWRSGSICPPHSRQVGFSASPPLGGLPSSLQFRHGVFSFKMQCGPNCLGFSPCPFGSANHYPPHVGMQLQLPAAIPPGSSIWALVPTLGPYWQRLDARIEGRIADFAVRDVPISLASMTLSHIMEGWVGIATPVEAGRAAPKVADMWWGGPEENGWGLSIAQDGDRLFATLLVYDDKGQPAFYLLRDGTWDAERKTFGGTLYRPDARSMGQPIGSLHLLFDDPGKPLLRYTLPSGEGLKAIQRMEFGPPTSRDDSQSGVWDLTLSSTGAMTLHKRGDTLFMSWLEFPGKGPGQWMVAPAGQRIAEDTYEATLYRTAGSAWATGYDASRLSMREVGLVRVRFTGADDGEVTYTIDGVTQTSPLRRHGF